jgi:hypothetical protein
LQTKDFLSSQNKCNTGCPKNVDRENTEASNRDSSARSLLPRRRRRRRRSRRNKKDKRKYVVTEEGVEESGEMSFSFLLLKLLDEN